MNEDPILEISALSQPISSGGRTVQVEIYRLEGENSWTLEIEDEHGNSTVWDDTFDTDRDALTEAKKAILEERASSFIGPEDGKANNDWK